MRLRDLLPVTRKQMNLILEASDENRMYQALYSNLNKTFNLGNDQKMTNYVTQGFEGNPDVYSIAMKASTMFSQIPLAEYDRVTGDEIPKSSLIEALQHPNEYQTLPELMQLWELFLMVTGNGMLYAPRLQDGNDKGKLMEGLYVMPSQYIDIKAKSWKKPVDHYTFEQDTEIQIPVEDVIHIRFPNLSYENGKNFMGMSPVKVAAATVDTVNYGRDYVKNAFKRGMPPGILAKKADWNVTDAVEQKTQMEREWLRRHGKVSKAGIPVFTLGELQWIKLGFDNFRDMQIIENNAAALRVLCNIWGVPSIVFNDTAGTTYNNQAEARKSIYTNRILPDLNLFLSYINTKIAPAYTNNIIKADLSGIEELQKNKKEQAEWIGILVDKGILTRNQGLELMGLEPSDDPGMDERFVPFNMVPLRSLLENPSQEEVDKILSIANIDDYKLKHG